ncbi:hypothetical protein ACJMK2_013655 [Sinanodonta woodiana]|uniref:Uncharacterized protein n=1 Tax=Sinanodonta woodiana TaxID=1069815 RepID=A0ABD3UY67_SINWO
MFVKVRSHSVIARLARERGLFRGITLPPDVRMTFEGISNEYARDLMWLSMSPRPRIVFMQIGENEVSYTSANEVINGILTLCQYLLDCGVGFVFIGALLPRRRPRALTVLQYQR